MSNNINITLIVKANSNQEEFKKFLNQSISVEEVNNLEKPIWRLSNVVKPYRNSVAKNKEENQLLSWGTYEDCCDENFETDGSTYIKINFSAAYGLPIPWMVTASFLFPNLSFSLEWMSDVDNFSVTQIKDGKYIDIYFTDTKKRTHSDQLDRFWFNNTNTSQTNPFSHFQF